MKRQHVERRVAADDSRQFIVRHQSHSGSWRSYGAYSSRAEAERIADLLRWAGAIVAVHVEPLE